MRQELLSKTHRMFLKKAKEAGVKIVSSRLGKGSHHILTGEYRGYWRSFTIARTPSSIFVERQTYNDIRRFTNTVDDLIAGLPVDLALGTPGAIFRCVDNPQV